MSNAEKKPFLAMATTTPSANSAAMASSVPRLDTAGIAELLGLTREYVTDCVTKRVDFPKPFINVSRKTRYWRTTDVHAWMRGDSGGQSRKKGAGNAR